MDFAVKHSIISKSMYYQKTHALELKPTKKWADSNISTIPIQFFSILISYKLKKKSRSVFTLQT